MPSRETVLITGAGGVGRLVIENLRTHDVPVRVMVRRDDDRAAELRRFGADVVLGDLTRPETVAAGLGASGGCTSRCPCPAITCWPRPSWRPWPRSAGLWRPWSACPR